MVDGEAVAREAVEVGDAAEGLDRGEEPAEDPLDASKRRPRPVPPSGPTLAWPDATLTHMLVRSRARLPELCWQARTVGLCWSARW